VIYTDGACNKNGKPDATGGFGIYLKSSCFGDETKINCKGELMRMKIGDALETFFVTNIRMEGMAIIATMFLYAEKFVHGQPVCDAVAHLNEHFLKQDRPLKLNYQFDELRVAGERPQRSFEIVTDSLFWMNVIQKWMPAWVRKGQLLQKKNPDLLMIVHYYTTLFAQNNVQMVLTHVRSHQRGKRTAHADGNDVADQLATASVRNATTRFTQM
jgi:ribonuclease HI